MPGKKRKAVIDAKQVAAYREKLRKREPPPSLKIANREQKEYTFKSPFPQEFSLPSNIIYYITRNPTSPAGHLKLISTCKSLLRMGPILPVLICEHHVGDDCNKWLVDIGSTINLKKQFLKLWIISEIIILAESMPNLASSLVKLIHKCSLREFIVQNQVFTFEELQVFVSGGKLENVEFDNNVVKNADGSITEFEKIFELICCKNLRITLHPEHPGIGKETTNKVIEILLSDQIPDKQHISLIKVPENLDFILFSGFLKANLSGRQHTIDLDFSDEISDAYKNQLQKFVDEILQMRGIYAHTVPNIYFYGLNFEVYVKYYNMRNENVEGILRK